MPTPYTQSELNDRDIIANQLITEPSAGLRIVEADPSLPPALAMLPRDLQVSFKPGTAPKPQRLSPPPDPHKPLPKADVVVVTYTQPEADALAHVLTPGR